MEIDTGDFANPPAKRQRTESPLALTEHQTTTQNATHEPPLQATIVPEGQGTDATKFDASIVTTGSQTSTQLVTPAEPPPVEDHGFLDALMQHVESESVARALEQEEDVEQQPVLEMSEKKDVIVHDSMGSSMNMQHDNSTQRHTEVHRNMVDSLAECQSQDAANSGLASSNASNHSLNEQERTTLMMESSATAPAAIPELSQVQVIDEAPVIPHETDAEELQFQEPETGEAEWEMDSSPIESSSGSDLSSDTDSDDSDEEVDEDYAMLGPEEQARILLAGDGGSDDEGGKKDKSDAAPLRTANEKKEEVIPKPDIEVTSDMEIVELGSVEGVVEGTVLVMAKISGEYQVLESGSLLCLADRSVVGVVAEPLGRVEQPMYTIRFTNNQAIEEAGLATSGTAVFYVPKHSSFVFTQPLKAVKGSDASNFHDEEVGDDEMEFSDDEAEAEHKRQMKLRRQGKKEDVSRGRGGTRGGRGNYQRGGGYTSHQAYSDTNAMAYSNGAMEMNYDDVPDTNDDGYTPLARPANLNEMMASTDPHEGHHHQQSFHSSSGSEPSRGRGRAGDRGRGDRGHRGGRRGRGGGRGAWLPSTNTGGWRQANDFRNSHPYQANQNSYSDQQYSQHAMMPPPAPQPYHQYQHPPGAPSLSPQRQSSYPPFSPSPISPLPPQNFSFNYPQPIQNQPQGYQSYHQQQGPMSPPGSHIKPAFMQNFQQHGPPGVSTPGSWGVNQAAAAQVAAQLEQMRRNAGQ